MTGLELIALAKAAGLTAKVGTLAYKGFVVLKGAKLAYLAKQAIIAAKAYGAIEALLMFFQMLIILGTVAATAQAADYAHEALEALADGKYKKAFKAGRKAVSNSNTVVTVWKG